MYRIKTSPEDFLERLKAAGYSVKPDTATKECDTLGVYTSRFIRYYLIENVEMGDGEHTAEAIRIGFAGNQLVVNDVKLKGTFKVSDWKQLKRYAKHYRKLIKSNIIEALE